MNKTTTQHRDPSFWLGTASPAGFRVLFQRASGRWGHYFSSFCRSQTPHGQCHCYNKSCLRRKQD